MDVTPEALADAEAALDRLDTFARRVAKLWDGEPDASAVDAFRAAMEDDLDTPAATAIVFDLVRRANSALDAGDEAAAAPLAAAVRELTGAVGLELRSEAAEVPVAVQELAAERDAARAERDWARADALREQIQAEGYVVEDGAAGTVVRPA